MRYRTGNWMLWKYCSLFSEGFNTRLQSMVKLLSEMFNQIF
jgi:hypothetical protein